MYLARTTSRHAVGSARRAGQLVPARRGALTAVADVGSWAGRHHRALARVAAVDAQLRLDHVISHQSAALLWGLPQVDTGDRVHVIQATSSSGRRSADIVRHEMSLDHGEVAEVGGVRVTTLARTIADCAQLLEPSRAIVIADAGLRAGADRAEVDALLARRSGRRGIVRARAVLDAADPGAESPGESLARHALLVAGLPRPETQRLVLTDAGPAWADLAWDEWGVLAEYDGAAKYEAQGSAAAAVLAERRREVLLERARWRVVRLVAADLRTPITAAAAVLRAAPHAARASLTPRPALADAPTWHAPARRDRAFDASPAR